MSEESEEISQKFFVERAKTGRANCKKCKQSIDAKMVRIAKVLPNPFGSGTMKQWHHVPCLFEVFSKQRASTAKIETLDDIGGWDLLDPDGQKDVLEYLPDSAKVRKPPEEKKIPDEEKIDPNHKDCSLREFRKLCSQIADHPSYLDKTNIVKTFITQGTSGEGFKGDLLLTVRLLLPGVIKRIYNLQSKQIVKLFSRLLNADLDDMLTSLEDGDVAETVRIFFEQSNTVKPAKKSTLTLQDIDVFLQQLSSMTREEEQLAHFNSIAPKCTANDLKLLIRFIKHDLRINAGAKHILDAVHPDAYEAFQSSRDLNSIICKIKGTGSDQKSPSKNSLQIGISVLTPVLPMLAQACKSAEEAMKKCPNGMFADIKYDGERVQVHKKGHVFKYFSRSLKPVVPHKVQSLAEYIPKAFPHGRDLVLDCEVLLMDTITSKPLPFGTLGIHKKNEFKDATVCLFVFDCIYYNGESLVHKPIKERRDILLSNMTEIPHRVVFSEMQELNSKKELEALMIKVFKEGLEGLVLKDIMSQYEPGKRHWLKIKKDYLFGGAMADTADLVVLGAWYGTGQKGGMMSVFLMGCYDEDKNIWCTVTKVHTGHDDATLESLQTQLKMVKISKDQNKVPSWLKCTKTMVPDFVAQDPKNQPVWEITGAELTKNIIHTADGISVRFPRVTRIRDDKSWDTATSLSQLKELYKKSKETSDFCLPGYSDSYDIDSDMSESSQSPKKKMKYTNQPSISKFTSNVDTSPKNRSKKNEYKLKHPLPDIFNGMKIVIPSDTKLMSSDIQQTLPRYFMAYGGEIINKSNCSEATHHVCISTSDAMEVDEDSIPITTSWLMKCISSQSLVPLSLS